MKIILAQTAGFCMGVKRAMQIAVDTAQKNTDGVYTCGPLIHNPQAVQYLESQGIKSVNCSKELESGIVIIRAHGMPINEIKLLESKNIKIVDATCPHVVTSQKKICSYIAKGYHIFIAGDKDHPEILSLQSFAADKCNLISKKELAENVLVPDKSMLIAQTTFSQKEFEEIAKQLRAKNEGIIISNSICKATSERQQEIERLAAIADAVIVTGGYSSANTKRLAQIASRLCKNTCHVETYNQLNLNKLKNKEKIVVTAGASTPDFITEEVIRFLEKNL